MSDAQIFTLKRLSNVVTVTTEDVHPFSAGAFASQVVITGVLGGGTAAYSGTAVRTITSVPDNYTFTYAHTGANGTASASLSMLSVARYLTSANKILLTFSDEHGIPSNRKIPIKISGVTQNSGTGLTALINQSTEYKPSEYEVDSGTTLIVTLRKAAVADWSPVLSNGKITSTSVAGAVSFASTVSPDPGNGGAGDGSTGTTTPVDTPVVLKSFTENTAVKSLLKIVDNAKASNAYFQRLLVSSDTSKITTNTKTAGINVRQPASTLRSALDSMVEIYGTDFKKRRYYVNLSQQLVYEIVDDVTPTYANAPYILTTALGTPNGTTTPSINPFSLNVTWDHDTTKRAVFNVAVSGGVPTVSTIAYNNPDALGTAYTRKGVSVYDATVDYPNNVENGVIATTTIAKAFFLERHAPVLSITAEIRGAGTAAWNNLGFSAGYCQTGASSYASVSRWEPGQFCKVVAPELGLNSIYRVEQVDWSLEDSSYQQIIRLTLNRRPAVTLASLVAKGGSK